MDRVMYDSIISRGVYIVCTTTPGIMFELFSLSSIPSRADHLTGLVYKHKKKKKTKYIEVCGKRELIYIQVSGFVEIPLLGALI